MARAAGGRVLLRIEDHDRIRSRDVFEHAILADLAWLGFVPDDGLHPVRRQSGNDAAYVAALARLQSTHRVYICTCSRKEIETSATRGHADRGVCCPATGRRPARAFASNWMTRRSSSRIGAGADRADAGGAMRRSAAEGSRRQLDLPVRGYGGRHERRRGSHRSGLDLLSSTGRQIKLARMLGRTSPPVFYHHPLIIKPDGEKLSKAGGDTGVRELRAAGEPPAAVIGRAARAVGLIDAAGLVDAAASSGSSAPPAEDDINGARKELRENPCAFGYVTVALFVLN